MGQSQNEAQRNKGGQAGNGGQRTGQQAGGTGANPGQPQQGNRPDENRQAGQPKPAKHG